MCKISLSDMECLFRHQSGHSSHPSRRIFMVTVTLSNPYLKLNIIDKTSTLNFVKYYDYCTLSVAMVLVPSVAILILFISEPGPGWGGHYHTLFIILESRPSSYGARDGNDVSCNNNVTRWLPSAPAATCWHGNNGKNMNSEQGHYVITAWLRSCRPRHYLNTWHSVTIVTRSQARIFIH